ncbi:DUF2628 domain-containing protein [Pararhizobium sp.]|uniref:DUF2628 domain-containing protein n=1 Tax=Pararhizobium sp. TaxID=1977563 RepID=UPI002724DB25|nr:DUF2628 domain-containing protein [Pararhizobium sp.]MDO9416851.1 DUF2628 domain-containing protein [Pararhizobium sp.]
MVSYLILTPPGGRWNDDRALFVADRFSSWALFFPALWLIGHHLWLAGIVVGVLQIVSLGLIGQPGFVFAGLTLSLALGLLVALEGPVFLARHLARRGWILRDIVPVDLLDTAEDLYFSTDVSDDAAPQTADWPTGRGERNSSSPGLELFGFGGER